MAKLLYVEASPRKTRSSSIAAARAFLDAYRAAHPSDVVDAWDLWAEPLPEFDGAMLDAKYAVIHGTNQTPEQVRAWGQVTALADRFKSADKHLISLPMWNFCIPYKLKHLIDVITQPGLTFSFSPQAGYKGLVTGKPAAVAYARGGSYLPGSGPEGFDVQKPYVELWLRFIGFTDLRSIVVEPTLGPPDLSEQAKARALEAATALGRTF
jgi:FMN-dependent NADH-azoreductase